MNIFILEDSSYRIKWFEKFFNGCKIDWTDNVQQSCNYLKNNKYDLVFLDRDLGETGETGEDLVKEMIDNKLVQNAAIVIHSINIRGKEMKKKLEEYHKNVHYISFFHLMKMKKEDFK